MLERNVFPQVLQAYNIALVQQENNLWWVQDGATAHRTNNVRDRIRAFFGRRVIAMGHDHDWPARSPDLTPCDFFLWGWIKQRVYVTPPHNVQELRDRILNSVQGLTPRMITNAVRAMEKRALNNNGGHVEGNN